MNQRQRVQAAIHRQPSDRIPKGELLIDAGFIQDYFRCFKGIANTSHEDHLIDIYDALDLDLICLGFSDLINDPGSDPKMVLHANQLGEDGFFIFCMIDGAFESAMNASGFMAFHKNLIYKPDETAGMIKTFAGNVIKQIEACATAGVDGIILGEDIAYKQGPYISPEDVNRLLLSCWKEQVKKAQDLNLPIFFHSDGNINALLPIILEAGFDGLQCIESGARMDIKEIKKNYGDRLCLMGNIDPALLAGTIDQAPDLQQEDLSVNDPKVLFADLNRAVTDLASDAADGGGFIFGTSSGLYAGLSPHKVRYMFELAGKLCLK